MGKREADALLGGFELLDDLGDLGLVVRDAVGVETGAAVLRGGSGE